MLAPDEIERTVHEVVRGVAAQRSLELGQVRPQMRLVDEIGFKSLDIARIIAVLELKLGVDPFARLVPVTSIRTVGDLCEAYRLGLERGPSREPDDDR